MKSSVVRVPGVLRGMDREAHCTLLTWKERSTTGRVYTRCRIRMSRRIFPMDPIPCFSPDTRLPPAGLTAAGCSPFFRRKWIWSRQPDPGRHAPAGQVESFTPFAAPASVGSASRVVPVPASRSTQPRTAESPRSATPRHWFPWRRLASRSVRIANTGRPRMSRRSSSASARPRTAAS